MSTTQSAASVLFAMTCLFGCGSGGLAEDESAQSSNGGALSREVVAMRSFDQLYQELREYRQAPEVKFSSSTSDHNDCEAFREIVARGDEFLPRIVAEIEKGDFFLNQAMKEITGLNVLEIYPDEAIAGEQGISRLWVRWWKSRSEALPREFDEETGSSDSEH